MEAQLLVGNGRFLVGDTANLCATLGKSRCAASHAFSGSDGYVSCSSNFRLADAAFCLAQVWPPTVLFALVFDFWPLVANTLDLII